MGKARRRKVDLAANRPARVEATLDRAEALKGADVVLTTILAGNTDVWRHDIEIPKKYGVDINVGRNSRCKAAKLSNRSGKPYNQVRELYNHLRKLYNHGETVQPISRKRKKCPRLLSNLIESN